MTTKIQARIDESLKVEGERILEEIGLTTTDLMRMTFRQLVMRKGLPFDACIPTKQTLDSFKEAKNPAEYSIYTDTKTALDDVWGKD